VNIWQSYNQERGCLVHFERLDNTLLKDEESALDNHVFVNSGLSTFDDRYAVAKFSINLARER